ncbi:UNVERIFIED_CONTAM: putative disease resistance RPP13-like protein 3 [Sesamum indicum]
MAAYNSLLSLSQILDNLQPHDRRRFFHNKDDLLQSLHEKSPSVVAVAVHVFGIPIAHLNAVFVLAQILISAGRKQKWVQVIKEMDFIIKLVQTKNACCAGKDLWKNRNILPAATSSSSRLHLVVVRFDGDLAEIKTRMIGASSSLEVVSIVGMGGIGKTTLARQVYDDSYIVYQFEIRAWVIVSQEYSFRRVLLGLLDWAKLLHTDMEDKEDQELVVYLYQSLKG